VVRYVPARTITRQKALTNVTQDRAVFVEVFNDVETVVVLGRVTVFGGEAVVNRDDYSVEGTAQGAAEGVVRG